MRNVRDSWRKKTQKSNSQKFNFDDISTFLFSEDPLEIYTFPFQDWKSSPLKNISMTFQIKHTISSAVTIKDIIFVIDKINNKKVNPEYIKSISFTILIHLYYYYIMHIVRWENYFYDNIKEYCKTSTSKIQWESIKYAKSYVNNSDAKAVWIAICSNSDREFWTKFAISLRESILPWLNAEMYHKYKDNKDNKRFNVEYDKQRLLMAEGDVSNMDISIPDDIVIQLKKDRPISFNNSSFSEEDLDEIKVGN